MRFRPVAECNEYLEQVRAAFFDVSGLVYGALAVLVPEFYGFGSGRKGVRAAEIGLAVGALCADEPAEEYAAGNFIEDIKSSLAGIG